MSYKYTFIEFTVGGFPMLINLDYIVRVTPHKSGNGCYIYTTESESPVIVDEDYSTVFRQIREAVEGK